LAGGLETHNAGFTMLRGDLSDPRQCRDMLDIVLAGTGQLDYLILNACAPPPILAISAATMQRQSTYIDENLKLFQVPLATFGPAVDRAKGAVVAISSSYVRSAPRGLSHYVALKQAVEGFVQSCANQFEHSAWLIARPPKLQTTWNDTPTGVAGAIPSHCAALGIVDQLVDRPKAGDVVLLEEFPSEADVRAATSSASRPRFSVAMCGSFTLDTLLDPIGSWFGELGMNADIEVAGYGQAMQELVNSASHLGRNRDGANLVLIRVRDWLRERGETLQGLDNRRAYIMSLAGEFARALVTHRQHAAVHTVVLLCPSAVDIISPEDGLIAEAEAELVSRATRVSGGPRSHGVRRVVLRLGRVGAGTPAAHGAGGAMATRARVDSIRIHQIDR